MKSFNKNIKFKSQLIILSFAIFTFFSCTTTNHKGSEKHSDNIVSIMAYNVENLFDTLHDENREDYSYLPLEVKRKSLTHKKNCELTSSRYLDSCLNDDWSEAALDLKMKRLSDAILQVNGGKGPDILILEEVENKNVLTQLNDKYLKNANYKTVVLIEGPDKRGIDIGFLSRLNLIESEQPQLHKIPYVAKNENDKEWMSRSRGILQVNFKLPDNNPLTIFGVHFPSPSNPRYWREQAIAHLNKLKSNLPKDRMAIAGGDFNISFEENSQAKHYENSLSSQWQVSHLVGCKGCQGTNYYHRKTSWSFLDALLFSKELSKDGSAPWALDPESIYIPNNSKYQVNRWLSPARFNQKSPVGVSDHWPIFAWIVKKDVKTDSPK